MAKNNFNWAKEAEKARRRLEADERKRAREAARAEREERRNRVRSAVQGGAVAAGMAITGAQAYDEPTQNSTNTQGNYADSEATDRRNNQARGQRRNTTYKGQQRGGSGQQS
ncbi:hypothetical protein G3I60_20105 [Streptomyces sp. SID13666]|uniref:hypothetical protein n=1 Tax=Streptomyces sp. SID13666 TaxID=2706054 RepID=UPI0013C012AF|nr:hypothetical protein [Streptomyces sp. SID13666]NEA56385.1 hypothetical protein [Streptomyces sp. SID13666]